MKLSLIQIFRKFFEGYNRHQSHSGADSDWNRSSYSRPGKQKDYTIDDPADNERMQGDKDTSDLELNFDEYDKVFDEEGEDKK